MRMRDWFSLYLASYIKSAIIVFQFLLVGLYVYSLVFTPRTSYNDFIITGRNVIIMEMILLILQRLLKHAVWLRVILSIVSIAVLDVLTILLLSEIFQHLIHTPVSAWILIAILFIIQLLAGNSLLKTVAKVTKIEKAKPKPVIVRSFFESSILGIAAAACITHYAEIIILTIPVSILIVLICVLAFSLVLLYFDFSQIIHEQLIQKHGFDPDIQKVLKTYKDGSVYISFPIESQAIGDFIDFHVFTLRNPKAVKQSSSNGAWYNIPKRYYELLQDMPDTLT